MKQVLIALLIFASSAAAQESRVVTLREAVRAALGNAPAIEAVAAAAEVAAASVGEAEAALDPQVTIAASVFRHDEPMIVQPIHGFEPTRIPPFDRTLIQSSVQGTLLLWDGGAARGRIDQARSMRDAAGVAEDEVRERIVLATVASYLEVLAASREADAEGERIAAIEAERRRIEQLRSVGRAAAVESFRAEAALEAARARRIDAETRLSLARSALGRLTGLDVAEIAAAEFAGAVLEREALVAEAALGSARVRRLQAAVEAKVAAVRAAEGSRKPQVAAAGNLLEYGSGDGDFTLEWNAGVHLRFNAIDGGAAKSRIVRARAEVRQAEADLEAAKLDVLEQLDEALAAVRRSSALATSYGAAIQSMTEVVRVERLRLENGVGVQAEYLRAEADLAGARAAFAASRRSLGIAQTELARITGRLDPQWVDTNFRSVE
ncbi:MAG: TolC family protein [Thermoanaerobaculia bacterium]